MNGETHMAMVRYSLDRMKIPRPVQFNQRLPVQTQSKRRNHRQRDPIQANVGKECELLLQEKYWISANSNPHLEKVKEGAEQAFRMRAPMD